MRRSRQAIDRSWPGWRYSPEGVGAVFQCEADVPQGWTRKPGDLEVFTHKECVLHDREQLTADLLAKGIDIDPTWGTAHMKKVLDS